MTLKDLELGITGYCEQRIAPMLRSSVDKCRKSEVEKIVKSELRCDLGYGLDRYDIERLLDTVSVCTYSFVSAVPVLNGTSVRIAVRLVDLS